MCILWGLGLGLVGLLLLFGLCVCVVSNLPTSVGDSSCENRERESPSIQSSSLSSFWKVAGIFVIFHSQVEPLIYC